ncbi:MAG: twin-arginine translocation signal domain-containing protein [Betaproteobacteria bacterium]|nr:MAG: twin-arginine translocation signal domain-containing protein [Betaproteobacteria bacterium]
MMRVHRMTTSRRDFVKGAGALVLVGLAPAPEASTAHAC